MSCGHCVKRITGVLESMGMSDFEVSLEEKKIFSGSPLEEKVVQALEEAGYPVTPEN
ncbi:MAG: heavy-metal-associated domain-containing protein [Synergistaceae bacterium]|nr:heavy-metal-associated domain-containing protein [Synergistales bacterium]MBP8995918.1 heavy-metal-associated domain-containing protein [Synergistales bacterium]NMD18125.1 heavy-metal-associated domain-containing protein [Synergistaceae bacterium]